MAKSTSRASSAEKSLAGQIAAHTKWSKTDPIAGTEAARRASPGALPYWEATVDPTNALPDSERIRRAESARRAHFAKLALASAKARRSRRSPA